MHFKSTLATAMLAASAVNAHMMMSRPWPYGQRTLNNSPLLPDGSDFPCKIREHMWEDAWGENNFEIGQPQLLSFNGSATHGGGSCQVSLTTDKYPNKNSKWQVIHSIQGGCPANVDGNLPGGPDTPDPYTFKFTIPDSIAPGEYTLAWTWFNRVGNREMYMNCAPINVTQSTTKRSTRSTKTRRANLPEMFVANINGCMTKEGVDIRFPDPGDSVDLLGSITNLLGLGQPACEGGPGPGATVPSAADSATPSPAAPTPEESSAPAPEPEAPTQPTSAVPAIFIPTASPDPAPVAESSPAAPVESSSSPAPSPNESGSGSSGGALTGACNQEGVWNCVGGSSFQRCASGVWSEVIQMAAGTACTAGQSDSLKIASIELSARSKIHLRRHMAGSEHA